MRTTNVQMTKQQFKALYANVAEQFNQDQEQLNKLVDTCYNGYKKDDQVVVDLNERVFCQVRTVANKQQQMANGYYNQAQKANFKAMANALKKVAEILATQHRVALN